MPSIIEEMFDMGRVHFNLPPHGQVEKILINGGANASNNLVSTR